MENNNPSILIRVVDKYDVDEVVPLIEDVGVYECIALKDINLVLGRVAIATDKDLVVKNISKLPEVVYAQIVPDENDD